MIIKTTVQKQSSFRELISFMSQHSCVTWDSFAYQSKAGQDKMQLQIGWVVYYSRIYQLLKARSGCNLEAGETVPLFSILFVMKRQRYPTEYKTVAFLLSACTTTSSTMTTTKSFLLSACTTNNNVFQETKAVPKVTLKIRQTTGTYPRTYQNKAYGSQILNFELISEISLFFSSSFCPVSLYHTSLHQLFLNQPRVNILQTSSNLIQMLQVCAEVLMVFLLYK